jgi:hypothetical protein
VARLARRARPARASPTPAVEHHPHFGIDGSYAFHAWYGFAVCAGMVLVSKFVVGLLLKRRDTYYDD